MRYVSLGKRQEAGGAHALRIKNNNNKNTIFLLVCLVGLILFGCAGRGVSGHPQGQVDSRLEHWRATALLGQPAEFL